MVPVINKIINYSKRFKYLKYVFIGIITGHYIYRYNISAKIVNNSKNKATSKLTPLITNILSYKLGIC